MAEPNPDANADPNPKPDIRPFCPEVLAKAREQAIRRGTDPEGAVNNAKCLRRAFSAVRRANNQNQPPNRSNTGSPSNTNPSLLPPNWGQPSTSPSVSTTVLSNDQAHHQNNQHKVPLFFRPEHSSFIVRGNFMTLAAKPHLVEEGEWLAHQIVEQNRLLSGMLLCVQEKDRSTGIPTCNETACPTMSAGAITYTWIDTKGSPINLPAPQYIKNIQTWVNGKCQDQSIFPIDNFTQAPPLPRVSELETDPNHWLGKTSGFPQRYENEIKNMYKQMFRCYAHLYFQHWITFWQLSAHRELNTCFVHFINVGRIYNLLSDKDIEPMMPLIELWIKEGVLPKRDTTSGGDVYSQTATSPSAGAAAMGSAAPPSG